MMHFSIVITIHLGSGFVLPVISLETYASSWQVLWNSSVTASVRLKERLQMSRQKPEKSNVDL